MIGAVTRVRHTIAQAIHRFFHDNGFFWVNTPIITASDAEGAGEMFRVSTLDLANLPRTPEGKVDFAQDFFGRETFLTVSGQLNVETYCLALSKVYTFGPTFRAENSNTSRHLAEFWMIEPEIAFADLADNATLAEALLKHIFRTVLDERADDMAFFEERIEKGVIAKLQGIVDSEFVRMDYTEAIRILEQAKQKFEFPVKWGIDLQSEHERYLSEKHAGKPVVLMNYPKEIKAFYMRVERRRQDRRGDGRARAGHRRDHRRQPARGAARRARRAHGRGRPGPRALRLVPRPAPLRHGAARGLRPGLRAHGRVRDRPRQRARRDPVPAHAGERAVLALMCLRRCGERPRAYDEACVARRLTAAPLANAPLSLTVSASGASLEDERLELFCGERREAGLRDRRRRLRRREEADQRFGGLLLPDGARERRREKRHRLQLGGNRADEGDPGLVDELAHLLKADLRLAARNDRGNRLARGRPPHFAALARDLSATPSFANNVVDR